MKKEKIEKKVSYELNGFMVVTNWYNQVGWTGLVINTDDKGLEEIKKEPLQDYINFGVQSVDYVYLDVFKIETWIDKDIAYTAESCYPIDTIEAGKIPEKVDIDKMMDDIFSSDYAEVNY